MQYYFRSYQPNYFPCYRPYYTNYVPYHHHYNYGRFSPYQYNQNRLNVSGNWKVTIDGEAMDGILQLKHSASRIMGFYPWSGAGTIFGTIDQNNLFTGEWSDGPNYDCVVGAKDRGHATMLFDANGQSFSGEWDYCDNGPPYTHKWSGTKIS